MQQMCVQCKQQSSPCAGIVRRDTVPPRAAGRWQDDHCSYTTPVKHMSPFVIKHSAHLVILVNVEDESVRVVVVVEGPLTPFEGVEQEDVVVMTILREDDIVCTHVMGYKYVSPVRRQRNPHPLSP